MEAGSLLQEALLRQADQQDLWQPDHSLWLDVHVITPASYGSNSIPSLLQLAQEAREMNQFFQAQTFDWHIGGDGPVFGIHCSEGIPRLRAICRYGASVADEWAAVEFIRQFTFGKENLAVECWDVQDGQIMLIESSPSGLPDWVDRIGPEACRHRCWIREGQVQLITPTTKALDDREKFDLDLREALETLRQGKTDTNSIETPSSVQEAIRDCISRFPLGEKAPAGNEAGFHHKAVLAVPRSVAFLIEKRPDLVNAAIVAFANHALYPAPTTSKSPKKNGNSNSIVCEDWVWTTHSFTRTNYAMLRTLCSPTWKSETFVPKEYQSVELKRLQRQCAVDYNSHLENAAHVGVRIVAGFNALLELQNTPDALSPKERRALHYWPRLLQEELGMSSQWLVEAWQSGSQRAVHNIENVLECPVFHDELESKPDRITPRSHPETSVSKQIQQLLKKAEKEAREEYVLPRPSEVDVREEWMVLTTEKLEESAQAHTTPTSPLEEEEEHAAQLDDMLQGFQSFMVDQSGFEGVANSKDKTSRGEVQINPRAFLNLLQTSVSPNDIVFKNSSKGDDAFFSKEDYEAMLPDEDVENDDGLPVDTYVVELMAAMDEELNTSGTGDVAGAGISTEAGGEAAGEARILSSLLQSLDADAAGRGPVQSMMKAMGQEPPLMTTDEATPVDRNEGA